MTITKDGVYISDVSYDRDSYSKYPSLGHCLLDHLDKHCNQVLLLDGASGRGWTGAQIKEKILNIATALIDLFDFKPRTTVCICGKYSDYACLLALGVICGGGIVACAHPLDPYPEILSLAQRVDPKFFFCYEKNSNMLEKLQTDLDQPVIGCLMDGDPESKRPPFKHFQDLFNYDHKKSRCIQQVPVAFEDLNNELCFIMMSSGSTGKPKAVPGTHNKCIEEVILGGLSREGLSFACTGSLTYGSSRMIFLGAIGLGYTAVIIDGFDPETFLKAVKKYKINIIYLGAASFYRLITYEHLKDHDISSVTTVAPIGGKVVYIEELRKFFQKYPNIVEARQGYGTSEFTLGAFNKMTTEQYLADCENCGLLVGGSKAKIIDTNTGEKLFGPKQVGMLHFSSLSPFIGYYDVRLKNTNSDSSPYLSDSSVFDEDGFYITGDLAYFNEKEQLYIVGRQKEIMSCRGAKKVFPAELEEVIEEHEIVSEVCVLGVPNQRELTIVCPRAFIIPKSCYYNNKDCQRQFIESRTQNSKSENLEHKGKHKLCKLEQDFRRLIERDIMEFVNERVGYEKQLTGGVVLLDEFPTMLRSGKIDKTCLRSLTFDQVEIYGDRSC